MRTPADAQVADLLTMVPATNLEIAWYPEESATDPFGLILLEASCQGAWEESCPPMHWVIGIHISVQAMDLEVTCEPAPASFGLCPGATK